MKFTLAALVSLLALSIGSAEEEKPKPREYPLGEDSMPKEGVPQGKVTKHQIRSEVYPGTIREYFVYVPAQYDGKGEEKAAVMVFQDGHAYVGENGQIRASSLFRTPWQEIHSTVFEYLPSGRFFRKVLPLIPV